MLYWLVGYSYWLASTSDIMDTSYNDGAVRTHAYNYHSMRSSNDYVINESVDLSSLGVIDLDTSIVPDAFGLRAFDSQKSVIQMLPRDFRNTVRILVPDAEATPLDFHDILLESLAATPTFWAKRIHLSEFTSLWRCGRRLYLTPCTSARWTWNINAVPAGYATTVKLVVGGLAIHLTVPLT